LSNITIKRPIIPAVLTQHLEEAAFYWLRRQDGVWSPSFDCEDLQRMDRLVDAHLEGVRVAGHAAIAPAMSNLNQWKTADEAFVATYILLYCPDEESLSELELLIQAEPELISGAAAALLWAESSVVADCVNRWWKSGYPHLRRAAIPAAMRHPGANIELLVQSAIQDKDETVQARGLRAIGEWRLESCIALLNYGLGSASALCRFEAAGALHILGQSSSALPIRDALKTTQGASLKRALMLWSSAASDEAFVAWMESIMMDSERYRDLIWAIAFRGDPAHFLYLENFLKAEVETALAAYALCHITGLDLDEKDLCLITDHNETEEEESHYFQTTDNKAPEDLDLLEPDCPKLLSWMEGHANGFIAGERYLNGHHLSQLPDHVFLDGLQPQRWQAALIFTRNRKIAGKLAEIPSMML